MSGHIELVFPVLFAHCNYAVCEEDVRSRILIGVAMPTLAGRRKALFMNIHAIVYYAAAWSVLTIALATQRVAWEW